MQRAAEHAPRGLVRGPSCGGSRTVAIDERPRLDPPVHLVDALEQGLDEVDRRQLPAADRLRRVDDAQLGQAHDAGSA